LSAGLAGGPAPDNFPARLAKYIPAEILSIYTAAVGALASAHPGEQKAKWIALGLMLLCAVLTAAYFGRAAPAGDVTRAHVIASPIAFLALAYPVSSALLGDWFIGYIAVLGQVVAALLAWFLVPTTGAAAAPGAPAAAVGPVGPAAPAGSAAPAARPGNPGSPGKPENPPLDTDP
jgi:hypothetical protein